MEDKNRYVDQLLDSALAQHRAAQPRPGLEGRILERVRATAGEEIAGAKAWNLWIAAAATAAVFMTLAVIRVARRPYSPAVQTSKANKTVPAPAPKEILAANSGTTPEAGNTATVIEPKRIARHENKLSHRVEAHHWPSRFPTPAPLTAEQKALVQYVRDTPPQVLEASLLPDLSESQPTEIKPVKFSSVQIQPLTVIKPGEELQ